MIKTRNQHFYDSTEISTSLIQILSIPANFFFSDAESNPDLKLHLVYK